MTTLGRERTSVREVRFEDDCLIALLGDERKLSVPLTWFPRLNYGTPQERQHWRLIGGGEGVHWPDLDEDISVESLLMGRASAETQDSIQKWRGNMPAQRLPHSSDSQQAVTSGVGYPATYLSRLFQRQSEAQVGLM
jgi:hypothetical protein